MDVALAHHLRARIKEERQRVVDFLANGRADSFADYRYLAGTVHGLDVVNRELDDLMVAIQKEHDRD